MTEQNFREMRRAMVASQLRTTGVSDPRVVAAMGAVPREKFVPDHRLPLAYADSLVPLKPGRDLNTPMSLGRLLTEAHPAPSDRALVVGAATGYAAAVLARLAGHVVALEEDEELAARAKAALAALPAEDKGSVDLVRGPLASGWKKSAPYDLILIDGAVEQVPQALIDQLADGGRLATGLIEDGVSRLCLGRKGGDGFGLIAFADAASAMIPGFEKPRAFNF
jgi:protein-L-isoaspartate(D-aspartate) O-methyltransferase